MTKVTVFTVFALQLKLDGLLCALSPSAACWERKAREQEDEMFAGALH